MNESSQSARAAIHSALEAKLGPDAAAEMRGQLADILDDDQRFLFDPDGPRPADACLGNLRRLLPVSDGAIDELITVVKAALLKEEQIRRRVEFCRSVMPTAEAAHGRILER